MNDSFLYDKQKFTDNYVSDINIANQTQLLTKLIFSSHSMEKSLSNDDFEIGHGFNNAMILIDLINKYKNNGFDESDLGYINTISVLKAFYVKHKNTEYLTKIENIFGKYLDEIKNSQSIMSGVEYVLIDSKKNNKNKNFKQLSESRFSVRTYSNKKVNPKYIEDAIQIATKTPSACNRQPVRVRVVYDNNIIRQILEIQGGIAFYKTPPVLILITADDNCYVSIGERNQGYIDGGLFLMSLLYALEYKSLAACPLHAMFEEVTERELRGKLNLPENEKIIAFVSVGNFNNTSNVCKSFRYPASYIMRRIDKLYSFDMQNLIINDQMKLRFNSIRQKLRPRTRLKNLKHKLRVRTRIKLFLVIIRNKKKDGAIVTLCDDFNYGNILQRYALQEFLRKNDLEFEQLSFYTRYLESIRNKHLYNSLFLFAKKYIKNSDFSMASVVEYKNYIVGSDQIWRNHGTSDIGYDYLPFWLSFVHNNKANRISYAASFGVDNLQDAKIDNDLIEIIRPLANNFKAISVREKSGIALINKITGYKKGPKLVLDPTLLLCVEDYSKLINKSKINNKITNKVFCYILDNNSRKNEFIKEIAKDYENDYLIINPKVDNKYKPVEEWLKGFRDSEFVITDSFHGMVFSIINNTDFIVFVNAQRGLARFISLLDLLDISKDRLISVDFDSKAKYSLSNLEPINWKKVNKRLNEERKVSGSWLLRNIKNNYEKCE